MQIPTYSERNYRETFFYFTLFNDEVFGINVPIDKQEANFKP